MEWQAPLLNGLLVVGGGSRCEGLAERLKAQLEQAAEGGWKVKITPPPAGAFMAWHGMGFFCRVGSGQVAFHGVTMHGMYSV